MGELILPEERAVLAEKFDIIRLWEEQDPEKVIENNADDIVAIVAVHYEKVDKALMERLPNLKIISTFSVGTDHIDLKAAEERGIKVTNTPDILCQETADTGVALLLATARRICEADRFVRAGRWKSESMPLGVTLAGKTAGIVGLGGIGSKVAKRCEAFDMNVVYFGPNEKPRYSYKYYDDVETMASDSDYLILTCPGGPETRLLVDAKVLQGLGANGILINISRGSVVDEGALIAALQNGTIRGAGLDVYENEPHVDKAFLSMDNAVLLPHIGSASMETRHAMGMLVVNNILAFFSGNELLTEVHL
jgi:lactate dehydrogenase-like 2-hydroxyacid dehydrogenase